MAGAWLALMSRLTYDSVGYGTVGNSLCTQEYP